ncbi:MAG: OmpW family protein [Hymenobacter sp.]|nr:MAG: OmpW family protein [Hymenobacter sp.]
MGMSPCTLEPENVIANSTRVALAVGLDTVTCPPATLLNLFSSASKSAALMSVLNTAFADDSGSNGKMILKGRLQAYISGKKDIGTDLNSNIKYFPSLTNNADYPITYNQSVDNPFGGEANATYFFSDNMAVSASVGYVKRIFTISGVGPQYNIISSKSTSTDTTSTTTSVATLASQSQFTQATEIKFVPISIAAQYHIAPYGKISPYVGVGYHYNYVYSATNPGSSSSSKIDNAVVNNNSGALFQFGVDSWIEENTLFNIEISKRFMTTNIAFKNNFAKDSSNIPLSQTIPISSDLKIDPIVISASIGIRL